MLVGQELVQPAGQMTLVSGGETVSELLARGAEAAGATSGTDRRNFQNDNKAALLALATPNRGPEPFPRERARARLSVPRGRPIAERIGIQTRFPSITLAVNTRERSLSYTGSGVAESVSTATSANTSVREPKVEMVCLSHCSAAKMQAL